MFFGNAALRQTLRRFHAAAPWVFPLLTDSRLLGIRQLLYRLAPGLARRVAERQLLRGELGEARRELAAAGGSAFSLPRLDEADAILTTGRIQSPLATSPAAVYGGGRPAAIVHAVHSALPIHPAGYSLRSQRILKAQDKAGWRVLACTRLGYPLDLYQPGLARQPDSWQIDGVKYRLLPAEPSLRRTNTLRGYIGAYAEALAAVAKEQGAEVIHGHSDYHNGLAAAWAAAATGRRSVYEARGLWHVTRLAEEPAFATNPLFRLAEALELEAMRQADAVVAISAGLRDWMVDHGIEAGKIAIVPNTVDVQSLMPCPREEGLVDALGLQGRTTIGYVGSLTAYEGIETVLDAMALANARGAAMTFVIVGTGEWLKPLRRHARRCGVADQVRFVGPVPPGEVARYYGLFDICPLMRRDEPVCRIVPPIKPLEIMAMAKPMVVSALPPLLELGEEGISRISIPADAGAEAVCEQLMRLANDPGMCTRMGIAARAWVSRNRSPALLAERYGAVYHSILSVAGSDKS